MENASRLPAAGGGSKAAPGESLAAAGDLVPTGTGGLNAACESPAAAAPADWQTAMQRAIRDPGQLRRRLGLAPESDGDDPASGGAASGGLVRPGAARRADSFATFVPLEYLARIRPGDPDDPLLRQVLPTPEEEIDDERFGADPVGDGDALAAGGVLHKYQGRALVITTGACGIHCRYCFRREFPYSQAGSRREAWRPSLDFLREHREIDEVLLSGGDPLTLLDEQLAALVDQIAEIDHVRRLRLHSRMPVVIPQRVTPELVDRLVAAPLAIWMVIHANHPRELDAPVLAAAGRLIDNGIPVLNQAVLLRGVNDRAETLIELCRKLVDHRIQPYYLHQLDRVRGTTHFEVPVAEGLRLVEQLRAALPGYAVPSYVAERAGESSKTPLSHVHL